MTLRAAMRRAGCAAWLLASTACRSNVPPATAALERLPAAVVPVAEPDAEVAVQPALARRCPVGCDAAASRVCGSAPAVCEPLARAIACDDPEALLGTMHTDYRVLVQDCSAGQCRDAHELDGRAELRWALDSAGGVAGLLGIERCAVPQLRWCSHCRNNQIVGLLVGDARLSGEGHSLHWIATTADVDADTDRDGFGVLDDACPDAGETYDGHDDTDGCPEPGGKVGVAVDRMRKELVFETPLSVTTVGGGPTAASERALARAADFLRAHPRLGVGVHVRTAGVGEAEVEAEARSIVQGLVAHGVADGRIDAQPMVDTWATAKQRRAHARTIRLILTPTPPGR